jgi:DNA polymerase V
MHNKIFALADVNNCFVSIERVFQPHLNNKPVLVLSSNDGCVIARSNEVKDFGIEMSTPHFKIKHLIKEHNIHVFSSNFALYSDMSRRIMALLKSMNPHMEVYSVDEAFLDFSGIQNPYEAALDMRQKVNQGLGVSMSFGIATTKTLTKIANSLAKKSVTGVVELLQNDIIDDVLKTLSIDKVWGIGKQTALSLRGWGFYTAYDLKIADPRSIRKRFSVVIERIVRELNGISCLAFEEVRDPKKSMRVSKSFSHKIYSFDLIEQALTTFTASLCQKLREQKQCTNAFSIFLKIKTDSPQGDIISKEITLSIFTNNTFFILKEAIKAVKIMFKENTPYKAVGITCYNLQPENMLKMKSLFSNDLDHGQEEINKSQEKSLKAMDAVNNKFGKGVIRLLSEGLDQSAWKAASDYKSQAFTTNWKELMVVK